MNIIYGVCGEGFGHSSRAHEIINYLEKRGHKILVVTYGQAYSVLKKFKILKIEGISLSFEEGRLSLIKTTLDSIPKIIKNLKNWNRIKKKVDEFKPDLCITDMEPVVPIISHFYKLPLISIDNQHRLTHLDFQVPKKYKRYFLIAKSVVNRCVSRAKAFIILSFVKTKTKGNVYVVAPILRKDIIKLKPIYSDSILVYLTKPDIKLIEMLKNMKWNFIVYGFDKEKKEGNLIFKKTGPYFLQDLSSCNAIIATAGFTLMSEALYLKKPYFAIPLKGQFEQTLNALFLKKSQLGTFSESPSQKEIEDFFDNLDIYKNRLKKHKMNPTEVFDVLDKILDYIKN